MTHDVFISHLPQEREAARAICAALEQRGLACWLAPRDLGPGSDYGAGTAEAIGASRLFLLLFSGETDASSLALREAEQADQAGLPILAFRIADMAPAPKLHALVGEWLDALSPPLSAHVDYLGDRILQLLGRTRRGPLQLTVPPQPFPRRRPRHQWLPIALAGLGGVAAIALAAAWVSAGAAQP